MIFFSTRNPSRLRKVLLAPATALYAGLTCLHRTVWLRPPRPDHVTNALPLIVVGSLRAGGAGKTPVTMMLARHLCDQGYRVGVLAYAVQPKKFGGLHAADAGVREVFPDSDWRETSDEAVLLARSLRESGARVFVTRDRGLARAALARTRAFDVLVSDDGLMDARLVSTSRVLRVALVRAGENPTWADLLPAGPYRLTASALRTVDAVLREGEDFTRTTLPPPFPSTGKTTHQTPSSGLPAFPDVWVLTGLGNPAHFVESLQRLGITVVGCSLGPDHGLPHLPRALRKAKAAGVRVFVCSGKDAIKLEGHPERPENLFAAGESVILSGEFLTRVTDFLSPPTS
jgi:tetraacyldisaccharide 4'-kinase